MNEAEQLGSGDGRGRGRARAGAGGRRGTSSFEMRKEVPGERPNAKTVLSD